ncbi:GTPase [Candidatus Hodgkinia cicadicola]
MKTTKQTIFSLASKLPCAIAIIRLSGNDTLKALTLLLGKTISANKACTLKIKTLKHTYKSVVTWWPCPYSPTGEDYAEINIAGVPAIANDIINFLKKLTLSQAKAGEFTNKAIANNKLSASDTLKLAKSLNLDCNLSCIKAIAAQIDKIITELELQLNSNVQWNLSLYKLKSLVNKIAHIKTNAPWTSVVGKANTGKSSLFNALTKSNRSIVSNLQGTTRDTVCAQTQSLKLMDTAGFKLANKKTEMLAALASLDCINHANTILLLHAYSEKNAFIRCRSMCTVIRVVSKIDLIHKLDLTTESIRVSSYSLEGIYTLKRRLRRISKQTSKISVISDIALTQALALLNCCMLAKDTALRIKTLSKAKTVLSKTINAPIINKILARFCIGK